MYRFRPRSALLSILSVLSLTPLMAQADAPIAVHGIVAATLGTLAFTHLEGNSPFKASIAGTDHASIRVLAGQDDPMSTARIAHRWDWKTALWQNNHLKLSGAWEVSVGQWQAPDRFADTSLTDIGLTPVFRLSSPSGQGFFVDYGVGAHYLSQTKIRGYDKSTQFQFGDTAAVGWQASDWSLAYRYLHVSNANIEVPNPSTDFHMIEAAYRYH